MLQDPLLLLLQQMNVAVPLELICPAGVFSGPIDWRSWSLSPGPYICKACSLPHWGFALKMCLPQEVCTQTSWCWCLWHLATKRGQTFDWCSKWDFSFKSFIAIYSGKKICEEHYVIHLVSSLFRQQCWSETSFYKMLSELVPTVRAHKANAPSQSLKQSAMSILCNSD